MSEHIPAVPAAKRPGVTSTGARKASAKSNRDAAAAYVASSTRPSLP